jgi:hypothetical protein
LLLHGTAVVRKNRSDASNYQGVFVMQAADQSLLPRPSHALIEAERLWHGHPEPPKIGMERIEQIIRFFNYDCRRHL